MDRILKIFEKLLKPRTIFTFLFFGATVYMIVNNLKVPKFLEFVDISLLAFYFGEQIGKRSSKLLG